MNRRPFVFLIMLLAPILYLLSCDSFYVSRNSSRPNTAFPGDPGTVSQTGRNQYPPYTGVVTVYGSKGEVKNLEYESLGKVTTSARLVGESEMLDALKRQAADLGANAIVLDNRKKGDNVAPSKMKALAIRVLGVKQSRTAS